MIERRGGEAPRQQLPRKQPWAPTCDLAPSPALTYRFGVTSCFVFTAQALPCDSGQYLRSGRDRAAAIFAWLLRVLAFAPLRDLVKSVDRMPIRSLLKLERCAPARRESSVAHRELQPDLTWTISRRRKAPIPSAERHASPFARLRVPGSHEYTLSRAPCVAESPTQRISATRNETRAIDQRGAAGNTRRHSGGRRAR